MHNELINNNTQTISDLQSKLLIEEYKEKMEHFRHSLTLTLHFFSYYLAITGAAFGYASGEKTEWITKISVASISVFSGLWGILYLVAQLPYVNRLENRLEVLSNLLGLQHQDVGPYRKGILFLFLFFLAVCIGWYIILYKPF
jgi:uncharacterized membrane protein